MDGFGVLEALKKKGDKILVIVSTNLSQEGDIEKDKALGAKDYFVKSDWKLEDVVKKVKEKLDI